eukprot:TRINITY_DN4413_c0_g1_i1.p1 TRINITY_DN4413_c0_g1~~TRINITY_DN4413_c0_g1_i1.p1  ORF type:complete len:592 (-),score=136.70 TRINITY_DN4413_c0_g1_i1:84-1859(-)
MSWQLKANTPSNKEKRRSNRVKDILKHKKESESSSEEVNRHKNKHAKIKRLSYDDVDDGSNKARLGVEGGETTTEKRKSDKKSSGTKTPETKSKKDKKKDSKRGSQKKALKSQSRSEDQEANGCSSNTSEEAKKIEDDCPAKPNNQPTPRSGNSKDTRSKDPKEPKGKDKPKKKEKGTLKPERKHRTSTSSKEEPAIEIDITPFVAVELGKNNSSIKVIRRTLAELPENVLKMWTKLGLSMAEIEKNIDLIFHVSWFIERDEFSKDYQVYERIGASPSYCTKEELETARSVISQPPKDLKKFCKAMEFSDKGGFGAVYSGKVPVGKKKERVAIKKLPHHSDRVMDNNLAEVFFLSQCSHPNIVEFQQCYLVDPTIVKDKKMTNTEIWITMEFLEGGTLSEAARASTFSDNHVAYVAREILKALDYLHDKKFVHRDLKSQNVMLSIKGEVKLIDFGLAADISNGPQTKMLGSPYWIPPEMILLQPHNSMADIWSFAVCILEFYLMSPPIYNSSLLCMYTAATRGLAHLIPEEATSFAKNFLQKCLVVDQTQRATTKELLKHPWVTRPNLFEGIPSVLRQIFLCHNLGSLGFV